jgi:hypothetical protein
MISGTTVTIGSSDIDTTGLNIPPSVATLPYPITVDTPQKVFLTTDSKVYVQLDDEWVLDTDARLISGQILGQQIGEDEISDTNISPLSISTPKLRSNSVDTRKLRADAVEARHIAANSINAGHLSANEIITLNAQIADAIIDDAKIVNLDASKIIADSVLAGSILVGSRALDTISGDAELGATNPAIRINDGSTAIDPGKITISGGTTLADWRKGGDETRIDGGSISANTIDANKLQIGNRNIILEGIEFEHNKPVVNSASWTAGTITYLADNGTYTVSNISAGSTAWTSGVLFIYWTKGATALQASANINTASTANTVVLASYKGGVNLNANYGRTIIDGSKIKTGTIEADQIKSGTITGTQIAADAIDASHISADAINASHIEAGAINTSHIGAEAIQAGQIAANAISAENIQVGTISADLISLGGVTYDSLAEGAVSNISSSTGSFTRSVGIFAREGAKVILMVTWDYVNGGSGSDSINLYFADDLVATHTQIGVVSGTFTDPAGEGPGFYNTYARPTLTAIHQVVAPSTGVHTFSVTGPGSGTIVAMELAR